jgi:serine/threonine-protein kinase
VKQQSFARRWLPVVGAAVLGFGLAYALVALFIFPPGAPPPDAKVPNVTGLQYDAAVQRLRQAGFKADRGESRAQETPKNTVVAQAPEAGSRQPLGTVVVLDVSAGMRSVAVRDTTPQAPAAPVDSVGTPDLNGRTVEEARILLEQLGLALGDVTIEGGGDLKPDAVITHQAPAAAAFVPTGTRVNVSVSGGGTP